MANTFSHGTTDGTNGWHRPNTTPIGQDRTPLTLKALLYLNVAVYAQVCRLFWVTLTVDCWMPSFGLVQARPWFRSSMWISSVAGISKILCTSVVASATRTSENVRHSAALNKLLIVMIQMVDRPNTTPIGQDRKKLTFKVLL